MWKFIKRRKEIGLTNEESLIIYKIDYFLNDFLIPITEYEIINPRTKDKLDLNICSETKINIDIPFIIDENNLYKYNPFSEYYKSKCYPYSSECEDHNILIERQKEFNNNYLSICEINCTYKYYDTITKKVKCECSIKTNFSKLSEILNKKNDILYHINTNFECLFKEKESGECENNIKFEDLIKKKYIPLNTQDSIDRVFELFSKEIKSINKTNDKIIEGENVIFHMTTTKNQDYYYENILYNNISSIDFGECEKIV